MEPQQNASLSRGKLILATLGTLVIAALVILCAVLPAEYDMDPLRVGKLTGISRLWWPPEKTVDPNAGSVKRALYYDTPFRTDVVEIPLTGFLGGAEFSELEYKVRMKKDATLIYSWEVVGTTERRDFHYDFHGHTLQTKPGEGMTVATYRQAFGLKSQGALTAPFDGIEGWQFSNSSEQPVVVRLRLAGFYELIPAGEEGNLAGIAANVPAPKSRPDYPVKLP